MGNSIYTAHSLLGSFQLFLHSDQPLSEGEIIPFSGVCPVGEAALSAGGSGGFTLLTDCFDVQPTTTSDNIITQSIISKTLASANSLRVFCIERSNITLTHLHVEVIAAFANFSSLAFLSAGLCR